LYFLSKFLPLIFSPLGLVFALLLTFIFRKKQKFFYSAIISLFFFSNGIVSSSLWTLLEYPWKRLNIKSMDNVDGIVVLSGGRHRPPGKTNIIEWNDPDRFFAGIELYKSKKANKIIFTGGLNPLSSNLPPEGDIYIKEAISLGIPAKNLETTYPVFNTFQEAKAVKKLLNKNSSSTKKVILVTSAFHMTRAKKVFEREGIIVKPYPVDFKSNNNFASNFKNPFNYVPNALSLRRSSSAIREIIGRIVYRSIN